MAESPKALRERWQSAVGAERASAVAACLVGGVPLSSLGIDTIDGRFDLRGIEFPDPSGSRRQDRPVVAEMLGGLVELRGVELRAVDFSYARLGSLRIWDSTISDAKFNSAYCRDWRLWGVRVERSSFRDADLHRAVLGSWENGRGNTYTGVDFSGADLRGLVSPAASYVDSEFAQARLDGVDFQSSSFVRCHFAGELRDVIFWDHWFRTGKPEPNPMEDVDFADATLRFFESAGSTWTE